MNTTLIVTQILTGVVGGLVYVLLALGLTLIFGLMRVVNFAHGAFYMLGAYTAVVVVGLTGSFWIALIVVPIVVGAGGLAVERGLIRPLYGRSDYDPLLLTFGLSFVLVELVKVVFGKLGKPFSAPPVLADALVLGSLYFPKYLAFMGLAAILEWTSTALARSSSLWVSLWVVWPVPSTRRSPGSTRIWGCRS